MSSSNGMYLRDSLTSYKWDPNDTRMRQILDTHLLKNIIVDPNIHIHDPTGYIHVKDVFSHVWNTHLYPKNQYGTTPKTSARLKQDTYVRFKEVVKLIFPNNYYNKLNYQVGLLSDGVCERKGVCIILAQVYSPTIATLKRDLSFASKVGSSEDELRQACLKALMAHGAVVGDKVVSFEDDQSIRKLAAKLRVGLKNEDASVLRERLVSYSVRYRSLIVA